MTQEEPVKLLHDKIKEDIDTAFRAGEKAKTNSLKSLLSEAVTEARKKEVRLPFNSEIILLIKKFIATATERAASYQDAGRSDDVAREQAEIALLTTYLPETIPDETVRAFIARLKSEGKLSPFPKGIGEANKAMEREFGDSFDRKVMTPIATEVLKAETPVADKTSDA